MLLPNRDNDSVEAPRSPAAAQLRTSVGAANIINHIAQERDEQRDTSTNNNSGAQPRRQDKRYSIRLLACGALSKLRNTTASCRATTTVDHPRDECADFCLTLEIHSEVSRRFFAGMVTAPTYELRDRDPFDK